MCIPGPLDTPAVAVSDIPVDRHCTLVTQRARVDIVSLFACIVECATGHHTCSQVGINAREECRAYTELEGILDVTRSISSSLLCAYHLSRILLSLLLSPFLSLPYNINYNNLYVFDVRIRMCSMSAWRG